MALKPKVRTGRLAPDPEALEYYNTPGRHWTNKPWDQIDMSKVDIGFHMDPTPEGVQALDRKMYTGGGAGEMKDLRIHVGNALAADDAGHWDNPESAFHTILGALENDDWSLAEQFNEAFEYNASGRHSTRRGDAQAIEEMEGMRQWLLDNDYQSIAYANSEEGMDFIRNSAKEELAPLRQQLDSKKAMLEDDLRRAAREGDFELTDDLEFQISDLDDEYEYALSDLVEQKQQDNTSYISLDPGNVRSADAAFQKDMIGKPDMMGSATPGMMGTLAGLGATGSVLASQSPSESLSQGWEALKGLPQMMLEDAKTGAEGLHYGLTGDRINPPVPQLNEETPLGNALAQDIGEYIGGIQPIPFSDYTVGEGIEDLTGLYNEYVAPNLSERQEAGLGGGALLGSMIGLPGKKAAMRNVAVDTSETRLGKQTAAANRKSLENQATRVREALAEEGGYETSGQAVDLESLPVLKRSDLEGGVFMPTAGDMTMRGQLDKSGGIEVNADLQGGPGYGALFGEWESTEDIARSYQDKVRRVAEEAGTDKVFGTYSPMRLEASNFSTMPAEVAVKQLDAMKQAGAQFDPAMVRRLDEMVRASGSSKNNKIGNSGFPGILSPEAEEFLAQNTPTSVAARKTMLGEMAKAPYRDAGFPLVDQIYRDVAYPELHGRDIGETGDLLLRLDPNADTHFDSRNRSYGTVIPGQGAGRLQGTAPFSTIYRDPWQQLTGAMTESKINTKGDWSTPRLLNQLEKTNTINWNKPGNPDARTQGFQRIDEQLLDELERLGMLAP